MCENYHGHLHSLLGCWQAQGERPLKRDEDTMLAAEAAIRGIFGGVSTNGHFPFEWQVTDPPAGGARIALNGQQQLPQQRAPPQHATWAAGSPGRLGSPPPLHRARTASASDFLPHRQGACARVTLCKAADASNSAKLLRMLTGLIRVSANF